MAILTIFAIICFDVSSQMIMSYGMESPSFTIVHEDTDKFDVLDTCYLTVTYKFRYRSNEKDDSLSYNDMMNLEMGSKYNAFYSRDLRNLDIKNTLELKKHLFLYPPEDGAIGFDILTDHVGKLMTVTNRIPYTTQVIEYTEAIPAVDWKYTNAEADTIMGYVCRIAEGSYGGRNWKVWYTDEIPVPYGPWKLNGAKGLVLKAADTENNFVFEAEGLTQKPQPIIRYSWDRKKMDKDEWKKFEKDMYANAGAFVRSTGVRINIFDDSEKGFHRFTGDWAEYYNPLEK